MRLTALVLALAALPALLGAPARPVTPVPPPLPAAPARPAACAGPALAAGLAAEAAILARLAQGAACRRGSAGAVVVGRPGGAFAVLSLGPRGLHGPLRGSAPRGAPALAALLLTGFPQGPAS